MPMSFPQRLIEGYSAFAGGRLKSEQDRFRQLAESGQSPEIMVIGCCDSRVAPEAIFDAGPGELFVARNIANLVPPYTPDGAQRAVSAALEFAVQALRVKHIVVLAHAQCGGIRAYAEEAAPLSPGDFIGRWIELIAPAAKAVGPRGDRSFTEYLTALEQQTAVSTLNNLMTFPCINILVERGKLQLHAAYFGVATGDLSIYDPAQKKFVRINPSDAPFKNPAF
ncbi:carbonic anhydrase [Undibacter mobilis]|uniref:carbonic anhydrase n=2 Tax=Undibacter mobilis TaxID=2292256 RepID=A0A371BDN8_9BRAD|nr:carbonic anhydrase [Undibacter mobilis]